jgi:arylsulfatase A-like enzyme
MADGPYPTQRRLQALLVPLVVLLVSVPPPACGLRHADRPPDVILVAMDNVRFDRTSLPPPRTKDGSALGPRVNKAFDTTPTLAAYASSEGSHSFPMAFSAASWSLPSYASILTGTHVMNHGVGLDASSIPLEFPTLAEVLSAYGYRSAAFVSGAHLAPTYGFGRGFEIYTDAPGLFSLGRQVADATAWLEDAVSTTPDKPLFLFVHGYDAHVPYAGHPLLREMFDPDYNGPVDRYPDLMSPNGFRKVAGRFYWPDHKDGVQVPAVLSPRPGDHDGGIVYDPAKAPHVELSEADVAHIVAHYDAAVRLADYYLGRLLRELDRKDRLRDAIVVVLADHGEALGERGYFTHANENDDWVFHVPLVLHLPDALLQKRLHATDDPWDARREPEGLDLEQVASLVDVFPTVLDAVGTAPPAVMDGHSVLRRLVSPPTPLNHEVYAASLGIQSWGVRDADWRLTVRFIQRKSIDGVYQGTEAEIHELRKDGLDPDVAVQNPEVVERLLPVFDPWRTKNRAVEPGPVNDPRLRKALNAAGYWQAMPDAGHKENTP